MTHRLLAFLVAGCLISTSAWAQADLVTTPPANLVISNYNSTSVGPDGGLEGYAFAARVDDPSAAWFNPAGLARQAGAQISGSAGVYQRTLVSPRSLPNQGGSIQQLPNFVGFTVTPRDGLTAGAALLSTNAWDQGTDSEVFLPTAAGQQRFAYSADSGFEQRVAAFGVGYHRNGAWSAGGGFAFSLMSLRLVQSASDRVADPASLRSLLVSARASGSALQLRTQGGAQYDGGTWRLGGVFRSPGLTLHKSGSLVFDGVLAGEPESAGASIFDPDARLEYHLPWEFQAGAAFVRPRVELEVDVLAYTSIDAYHLLSSDQPVRLYTDAGNAPPAMVTRPFVGLTVASKGLANVAVGGHVRPFSQRDLRIHAGVSSNGSPVAPEDTVFSRIDLTTWSLGASGTLKKFSFAVGFNRQTGKADEVRLQHLLTNQELRSRVDVHIVGFIYSLAYQF
jgi:hypothetical protein